MEATLIVASDPFNPARHRQISTLRRRRRIRALAPRTQRPFICLLNGKPLLRASWSRKVRDGDHLTFVTLPQGGGGEGGSNPIAAVLMIGLMLSAPWMGSYLGVMTGVGTAEMWGAAVMLAGGALINALVPPPSPPTPQIAAAISAPSPTYSLGAQGNTARIDQPIPVIYGRHVVYPDFAAQPYTEFAGNDQYIYQLFVIGQGSYTIEQIRIEDTLTSSFDEITTETVAPGGTVTLFPANVDTSVEVSGQTLTPSGTSIGPFVASASGTTCNYIGVDIVMPRGLYYANTDGSLSAKSVVIVTEARPIDDAGAPTGAGTWTTLGTETYTKASTTPQRVSYKYAVSDARYEVKVKRTDTIDTSSQAGHEAAWAGLRAYLPGSQSYGNVTVLAMRMLATNNLSAQASRKVNCIVTRKLSAWNGSSFDTASDTRSIAWALADICTADYGANLGNASVDLDGLLALDAVWAGRGDYFDAIFDSQITIWDALTQVARAGRAVPVMQSGIIYFMRDSAVTTPVALFSPRNMIKGSFNLSYALPNEDSGDAIDVGYFDNGTWQTKTVRSVLDTETAPVKVSLFGVTGRDHAWREGMYMAACNRYRRRSVTFSSEMEGLIVSFGDLIAISHDMPQWGQYGEITAWDAGTNTATCSQVPDFSAGGTHQIALRDLDGSVDGPYTVTVGSSTNKLVFGVAPTVTPYTGHAKERTHYAFGPVSELYVTARVQGIKPKNDREIEINGVVESAAVHTADTGAAAGEDAWQLPTRVTVPVLTGLLVRSDPDTATYMYLSWQPAPTADHYLIEVSDSGNGWTRIGDTSANNFTAVASYGARTVIRVAAVGLTRSAWVEINYGSSASYMWDVVTSTLMWSATSSDLMWRY